MTIILKGGYFEWSQSNVKPKLPGSIGFKKPEDLHRLSLMDNKPCWTLFFRGATKRKWGFVKDGQWIESQEYLRQRQSE
jgi:hypothetical protein